MSTEILRKPIELSSGDRFEDTEFVLDEFYTYYGGQATFYSHRPLRDVVWRNCSVRTPYDTWQGHWDGRPKVDGQHTRIDWDLSCISLGNALEAGDYEGLEIDGLEVSGFPWAGVQINPTALKGVPSRQVGTKIHTLRVDRCAWGLILYHAYEFELIGMAPGLTWEGLKNSWRDPSGKHPWAIGWPQLAISDAEHFRVVGASCLAENGGLKIGSLRDGLFVGLEVPHVGFDGREGLGLGTPSRDVTFEGGVSDHSVVSGVHHHGGNLWQNNHEMVNIRWDRHRFIGDAKTGHAVQFYGGPGLVQESNRGNGYADVTFEGCKFIGITGVRGKEKGKDIPAHAVHLGYDGRDRGTHTGEHQINASFSRDNEFVHTAHHVLRDEQ